LAQMKPISLWEKGNTSTTQRHVDRHLSQINHSTTKIFFGHQPKTFFLVKLAHSYNIDKIKTLKWALVGQFNLSLKWYPQSKDIFSKSVYEMACRYSAFNAQGSRLIIVPVQLGAVKLYVATVEEALGQKRKDRMKLSLPHQFWWFSEFHPPLEW
jgi:hypothetical protein